MPVSNFVHRQWKEFFFFFNELGFDAVAFSALPQPAVIMADSRPRDAVNNVFCTFQHPHGPEHPASHTFIFFLPRFHTLATWNRQSAVSDCILCFLPYQQPPKSKKIYIYICTHTHIYIHTHIYTYERFSQNSFSYLIRILTVAFIMITDDANWSKTWENDHWKGGWDSNWEAEELGWPVLHRQGCQVYLVLKAPFAMISLY